MVNYLFNFYHLNEGKDSIEIICQDWGSWLTSRNLSTCHSEDRQKARTWSRPGCRFYRIGVHTRSALVHGGRTDRRDRGTSDQDPNRTQHRSSSGSEGEQSPETDTKLTINRWVTKAAGAPLWIGSMSMHSVPFFKRQLSLSIFKTFSFLIYHNSQFTGT